MVNVIKLFFKLLLLFLTICMTIVTLISGISVGLIFSTPDNISFDLAGTYIDINGTQLDLGIPYSINNVGYYDVNNLEFNYNISAYNQTDFFGVAQGFEPIGSFPAQTKTENNFNMTIIMSEPVNQTQWFLWNISLNFEVRITGLYALDLMSFTLGFAFNYSIGGP